MSEHEHAPTLATRSKPLRMPVNGPSAEQKLRNFSGVERSGGMRAILVLLCSSCVATEVSPVDPAIDEWLVRWRDARSCLVVPTEDVETGSAISILEGRDCGPALQDLERVVPVTDDAFLRRWRASISRLRTAEASGVKRAVEITKVEAGALALAAAHGLEMPPIRWMATLPRASISDRLLDSWDPKQERTPFAYIHAGNIKVLATRRHSFEISRAYGLTISRTAGASWKNYTYAGNLVAQRHYLDTSSIDLIVERLGLVERHRIAADGEQPRVTVLPVSTGAKAICTYGDITWSIHAGTLHRTDADNDHVVGPVPDAELRCGPKGAVLDLPDRVYRCRLTCRQEFRSPVPDVEGYPAILDDGRWLFVVPFERVAAIWIEGAQTPFYVRMTSNQDWGSVLNGSSTFSDIKLFPPFSSRDLRPRIRSVRL